MSSLMVGLLSLGLFATNPTIAAASCTVSISATDTVVCEGEAVTLTASGGSSYVWNNSVVNGQAFTPTSSEWYVVQASDGQGCVATDSVFIEVLPQPDIEIEASETNLCLGDSVVLTATGGVSYNWLNPAGISNGSVYTPTQVGGAIYEVEGTGANGCINTSQIVVVVKAIPAPPVLDRNSNSACQLAVFNETITATADSGRVFWYSDAALQNLFGQQFPLTPPTQNSGQSTYYASTVLGGCNSPAVPASVTVLPLPEVEAGADIAVEAGEEVMLSGEATGSAPLNIQWISTQDMDDPTRLDPVFSASNSEVIVLEVEDSEGCINRDSLQLEVSPVIKISNLITPNGDGNNDTWQMQPAVTRASCTVQVFDGFGRVIFESDDYQNEWDGTYEGEALPDGDYYYYVQCPGIEEKGTLILIR